MNQDLYDYMNKKKYSSVIFDLDGTLLDTGEGVVSAVKETVRNLGLKELKDDEYRLFNGPPMKQSMKKWFGMDEASANEATKYFRTCYLKSHLFNASKYPHEDDLLSTLKTNGISLGVATYKRTDYAQSILEHFNLAKYFDVICGDTVNSTRKKAEIIKIVLDELGGYAEKTVMVGDMSGDYEGAVSAGIDFIGVTYGYGYKNEDNLQKFVLCHNMLDLLTCLIL